MPLIIFWLGLEIYITKFRWVFWNLSTFFEKAIRAISVDECIQPLDSSTCLPKENVKQFYNTPKEERIICLQSNLKGPGFLCLICNHMCFGLFSLSDRHFSKLQRYHNYHKLVINFPTHQWSIHFACFGLALVINVTFTFFFIL